MEIVRGRNFEHSQVHRRILVAGEADVSNLPRLFRIHQGFERPAGGEEAVGILHPDVLVKLNQVDMIRLQSPQRFIDLAGRGVLRPAIEFSHQKHFLPVPVTERKPHAPLAFPIVVIPAVVHEGDAAVDRTADDANPFVRILRATDVMVTWNSGGGTGGAAGEPLYNRTQNPSTRNPSPPSILKPPITAAAVPDFDETALPPFPRQHRNRRLRPKSGAPKPEIPSLTAAHRSNAELGCRTALGPSPTARRADLRQGAAGRWRRAAAASCPSAYSSGYRLSALWTRMPPHRSGGPAADSRTPARSIAQALRP